MIFYCWVLWLEWSGDSQLKVATMSSNAWASSTQTQRSWAGQLDGGSTWGSPFRGPTTNWLDLTWPYHMAMACCCPSEPCLLSKIHGRVILRSCCDVLCQEWDPLENSGHKGSQGLWPMDWPEARRTQLIATMDICTSWQLKQIDGVATSRTIPEWLLGSSWLCWAMLRMVDITQGRWGPTAIQVVYITIYIYNIINYI